MYNAAVIAFLFVAILESLIIIVGNISPYSSFGSIATDSSTGYVHYARKFEHYAFERLSQKTIALCLKICSRSSIMLD